VVVISIFWNRFLWDTGRQFGLVCYDGTALLHMFRSFVVAPDTGTLLPVHRAVLVARHRLRH